MSKLSRIANEFASKYVNGESWRNEDLYLYGDASDRTTVVFEQNFSCAAQL